MKDFLLGYSSAFVGWFIGLVLMHACSMVKAADYPPIGPERPTQAIPWGNTGTTSYWTPDGRETRIYQLTPGQSYWTNDQGESGYIYNNFVPSAPLYVPPGLSQQGESSLGYPSSGLYNGGLP